MTGTSSITKNSLPQWSQVNRPMSIDWNSTPQGIVVCLWQYGHKGMNDILPQRFICHNFIMCGRYRLSRRKQILEEHFDSVSGEDDWRLRVTLFLQEHHRTRIVE